jgi:hypothetical protein
LGGYRNNDNKNRNECRQSAVFHTILSAGSPSIAGSRTFQQPLQSRITKIFDALLVNDRTLIISE